MIDFWEIMGRFAMDEDLRDALLTRYPAGNIYPVEVHKCKPPRLPFGHAYIPAGPTAELPHAPNVYAGIRRVLRDHMPARPFSLIALGTMLYALTFQEFRDGACRMAAELEKLDLDPVDDGFYIGLGALIVDKNLAAELIANRSWYQWGFDFIHKADRRTLELLFNRNKNLPIVNAARDWCNTEWPEECLASMIEWPAHAHPVDTFH